MPGSIRFSFSDAEELEAALHESVRKLVSITGGRFHARLTQIVLNRLRLSVVENKLPAIAVIAIPPGSLLVTWHTDVIAAPVWGGSVLPAGQIVTLAAGLPVHVRSDRHCMMNTLCLSADLLAKYGQALTRTPLAIPPGMRRWRPLLAEFQQLSDLHQSAIFTAGRRAGAPISAQAAHGLEQQVMHALVECLTADPEPEITITSQHQQVMARFEALIRDNDVAKQSIAAICARLGVSTRVMSLYCERHLGMGPARYLWLCRMHMLHHALRRGDSRQTRIGAIAQHYGFRQHGRLSDNYFQLFGELPSETLGRSYQLGRSTCPGTENVGSSGTP